MRAFARILVREIWGVLDPEAGTAESERLAHSAASPAAPLPRPLIMGTVNPTSDSFFGWPPPQLSGFGGCARPPIVLGAATGRAGRERPAASVTAAVLAVGHGARIVRVHDDVAATRDALRVWRATAYGEW